MMMAYKQVGPRRRRYDAVLSELPTLQEWETFISQPGPEGGWSATPAPDPFVHKWRWRRRDDTHTTLELFSLQALHQNIRKLRRGRAVPQFAVPKEILEIILEGGATTTWVDRGLDGMAKQLSDFAQWVHTYQLAP